MHSEAGQAALEMAMAMPLCLAVVFGMIQSALVLQTYCNATYACRNAARYASIHSSTSLAPSTASQIQTMVKSGLFLNASITPTVTVGYSTGAWVSGTAPTFCNTPSSCNSYNVVGNLVVVKATWSQSMTIPFMPTSGFTVGTQTYKLITR
jgi:Flp pilus assembly protein TadG